MALDERERGRQRATGPIQTLICNGEDCLPLLTQTSIQFCYYLHCQLLWHKYCRPTSTAGTHIPENLSAPVLNPTAQLTVECSRLCRRQRCRERFYNWTMIGTHPINNVGVIKQGITTWVLQLKHEAWNMSHVGCCRSSESVLCRHSGVWTDWRWVRLWII